MKIKIRLSFLIIIAFSFTSLECYSQNFKNQLKKAYDKKIKNKQQPSSTEIVSGLKEALVKGISNGVIKASSLDGYYKNDKLRIPFPPETKYVGDKLRKIGLGKEVDKFELSLNRAAEEAAKSAKSIFIEAIKTMTINDALSLLKGDKEAATNYLRKNTELKLSNSFSPIVDKALNKTKATQNYSAIVKSYNKIPFAKKVSPNLKEYATQQAINGLFILVAEEEAKIRKNPLLRTTDLLKKVFALQD